MSSLSFDSSLLEQQAQVIQVAAGRLTLIPLAGLGCARCAAGQGCGGALFGRRKAGAPVELAVSDSAELSLTDLKIGDVVVLGVPAPSLQRLVLWSYGLPLVLMVALVALAVALRLPEPVQAGVALLALLGSAMAIRRYLAGAESPPLCRLLRRESMAACTSGHLSLPVAR